MMTRIASVLVAAFLCAGLALGLSGCNSAGGNPRIGVALCSVDDSFVSSARRALEAAAQGKARLSVLDGQNKQSIQNEQIEALVADKAEAIIVNPVDSSTMTSIVFRAKSANVPIVFFSRELSIVSINMWDKAYLVGVNIDEADALQVKILADYWKANTLSADKNEDGKLQYVLVRGDTKKLATETSAENRQRAFDDAGVPAVMLAEASTDWTRIEARKKMADLIQSVGIKKIEAVVCGNDEIALGAIEALKVAGMFQKGAFIPVVGVDGTSFAMDAIAEGSLLGTVRGDADSQGRAAFDLAYALAKGYDPAAVGWNLTANKYVRVPYQKVTRENYQNFRR
jgi:methyl-galactoside transport system substrate-binding protein